MFGRWTKRRPPAQASREADLAPLQVLQIIYNPLIEDEGGRRLTDVLRWHEPDRLAAGYSTDLTDASHGIARFEIVDRVELDEWPAKQDGFRYDDRSYLRAWRERSGFHQPDGVNYHRIIERFAVLQRIAARAIDEVWLFGPPYSGFWESTMAGPGAFWCNSPPVAATEESGRRFVIMGFNYERGVDCMLENFGHRTESIMSRVYQAHHGERNRWEHFCRHEQVAPGRSSCGNVHFAPNSAADYDWGNPRVVWSDCDDWYHYPDLQGARRRVHCQEWGGGDMRLHHLWWLGHLPRASGANDGVLNNWWRYLLDANLVI
jgi:hypothetical protein